MKTSEAMDTDLMDMLDLEQGWFGLTKYGGKYHVEHQGGRIGPFFSIRGALLAFDFAQSGAQQPETAGVD